MGEKNVKECLQGFSYRQIGARDNLNLGKLWLTKLVLLPLI